MATATAGTATEVTTQPQEPPKKRSKVFVIILILLVVVGAWFGISHYIYAQHHETTDDAQVASNISPVIPRVSGYVAEVRVTDNQRVRKGDTLIKLDDRDLRIRLEQAEAALATANANLNAARATSSAAGSNIGTTRAALGTLDAQIAQAKVSVWRATQDYNRYSNLIKDHSITQQQYEQALAAKQTADGQLAALQAQRKQAESQVTATSTQSGATSQQIGVANSVIKQRQADVDNAKLELSYAVITAPADGLVSKVNIQPGQYLNAGQSLFSIVLNQNVWVVANFKETQLDKMRVGQTATLTVDAFPGHDFKAK